MISLAKLAGAFLAGMLLTGCGVNLATSQTSAPGATAPAAKVGEPMPEFSVAMLDGQTVRMADFAGKPAVINFWAGWCSACVKELPAFQSAAQQLPSNEVQFLFVNFQDNVDSVNSYLSQLGFTEPVALDGQGQLAKQLQLVELPTTFFVDGTRVLRSIHTGEISSEQLDAELQAILPDGVHAATTTDTETNAVPLDARATSVPPASMPRDATQTSISSGAAPARTGNGNTASSTGAATGQGEHPPGFTLDCGC